MIEKGISVDKTYDRGHKNELSDDEKEKYKKYHDTVGKDAVAIVPGDTISIDTNVAITCISSNGMITNQTGTAVGSDENDQSVSLLLKFGSFSYFIGGDLERATEVKIADDDLVMNIDVYQSNHHGAETSSTLDLMNDILPSLIVISNGNNKTYAHPRQKTLDAYESLQSEPIVLQTNKYFKKGKGGNVPDDFIADKSDLFPSDKGTITVTYTINNPFFTVSYDNINRHIALKNMIDPYPLVIESLLPNPEGNDNQLEMVTLRNKTAQPVSLNGWRLEDKSKKVWLLDSNGQIGSHASINIIRDRRAMSLNNKNEIIYLVSPDGSVADSYSYTTSQNGITIITGKKGDTDPPIPD